MYPIQWWKRNNLNCWYMYLIAPVRNCILSKKGLEVFMQDKISELSFWYWTFILFVDDFPCIFLTAFWRLKSAFLIQILLSNASLWSIRMLCSRASYLDKFSSAISSTYNRIELWPKPLMLFATLKWHSGRFSLFSVGFLFALHLVSLHEWRPKFPIDKKELP